MDKSWKKIIGLRSKTYSYFEGNNGESEKAKETKKSVIKRELKLIGYEKCLKASQILNIINYLESKEID